MQLIFDRGLIPVVVQDHETGEVLMVAYANEEAIRLTRETGFSHFFSRSRKKIWKKGEESGHLQKVIRILVDCDGDSLLYQVDQVGGAACHTGHRSCFYRTLDGEEIALIVFDPERVYANKEHQ
ncbi:MAG: phosphoribosyl-AMP cyclohydrolase [Methanomicrobiales archaeon]|nr:phosphoribosyl-AMP cyclohydrolase [Methanomicrobiales archaeon]